MGAVAVRATVVVEVVKVVTAAVMTAILIVLMIVLIWMREVTDFNVCGDGGNNQH